MSVNADRLREFELRAAVAILMFDTAEVQRLDIRKLLPPGRSRKGKPNTVSKRLTDALAALESLGPIMRQPTTVTVTNRNALCEMVLRNLNSTQSALFVEGTLEQAREQHPDNLPEVWRTLKNQAQAVLGQAAARHL